MSSDEQFQEHYRRLEHMYAQAPINEYFRPRLTVSRGRTELRIAVRPDFHHAAGAVHGSVYFKAMDDAAFFAVQSLDREFFVLTVSFNIYLTRPISEGGMVASGKVVHHSTRLYLAEAEVCDSQGRSIARGSGSFMRSRIALDSDLGYD